MIWFSGMGRLGRALLCAVGIVLVAQPQHALAVPKEIIILRHGEKKNPFELCTVGVQRSLALRATYLGQGASDSLFAPGEAPAAFFAITLHTLDLASPSAASWKVPVVNYSVVPLKGVAGYDEEAELDERTREAAADVMTNPVWDGKIVVMVWEHKHIANSKIEKRSADPVTLRDLLNLSALGKTVPKKWSGTNYDYFWIVRYSPGSATPVSFEAVKQVFGPAFGGVPQNDWETPNGLTADSGCE
jgi:hypothetical protein